MNRVIRRMELWPAGARLFHFSHPRFARDALIRVENYLIRFHRHNILLYVQKSTKAFLLEHIREIPSPFLNDLGPV
jgi:hypothetical protein